LTTVLRLSSLAYALKNTGKGSKLRQARS